MILPSASTAASTLALTSSLVAHSQTSLTTAALGHRKHSLKSLLLTTSTSSSALPAAQPLTQIPSQSQLTPQIFNLPSSRASAQQVKTYQPVVTHHQMLQGGRSGTAVMGSAAGMRKGGGKVGPAKVVIVEGLIEEGSSRASVMEETQDVVSAY